MDCASSPMAQSPPVVTEPSIATDTASCSFSGLLLPAPFTASCPGAPPTCRNCADSVVSAPDGSLASSSATGLTTAPATPPPPPMDCATMPCDKLPRVDTSPTFCSDTTPPSPPSPSLPPRWTVNCVVVCSPLGKSLSHG